MRSPLTLVIPLALSLSSSVWSQATEAYLVHTGSIDGGGSVSVRRLELAAGGVLAGPRLTTPQQPQTIARDAALVGADLWVGSYRGIVIYEPSTMVELGVVLPDLIGNAVIPTASGGAVVFGFDRIAYVDVALELDSNGAELRRTVLSEPVLHAVPYQQGYLVVRSDRFERLDANFNAIGPFAPNAAQLAAQENRLFMPWRLSLLDGGRVALCCQTYFITTDGAGLAETLWEVGFYEQAAVVDGSGNWVVANRNGLVQVDPLTGRVTGELTVEASGFPFFTAPRPVAAGASSARFCAAAPNSTGSAASISVLASDDVRETSLRLAVRDVPAGALTVPIHGQVAGSTPYGNGTLCISPVGGITRSAFGAADPSGVHEVEFTFALAGLGLELLPGTTWHFQAVYRDAGGAGFSTSDAVTLRFVP